MKKDHTNILKKTIRESKPSIIMVIGLLTFSMLFKPGFEALVVGLFFIIVGFEAWQVIRKEKEPDVKAFIKSVVVTFIYLYVVFALYYIAGGKGIMAVLGITVLVALYILWRNRTQYLFWIEHIEKTFLYDGKTAYERKEKKK